MDSNTCLTGCWVALHPLTLEHVDPLCAVALDPDLWRWTTHQVTDRQQMQAYVEEALRARDAGTALPFVTIERATGTVVGSTRFGAIERAHRRAEIGWTFVAKRWQRTAINTEAKLLMLRWAFEDQGMMRVELKTDVLNRASRRAIARLGATEEGVFRKHMVCAGGRIRDTVYFSIIDDEWPEKRTALEERLRREC